MRHALSILCFASLLSTSGAAVAQPTGDATDLPITRAVLFTSGVGYFEHSGAVDGDATVRLMFRTEQINDVLKSMVLMDLDGGSAATVAYASKEPIERALASFGVDISDDPTLPRLLTQLRGAEITVDSVQGRILTVEEQTRVIGQPEAKVTEHVLRLVTGDGIQSIPLSSVQKLQLKDSKLQGELNDALLLLIGARDTDRKPVDVRFTGKGRRRVRIGYLIESPVWKTSYRLDLSDKPLVQGWAIVENATDNDWKDISLALVSGQPISFEMDLYTQWYVDRPQVKPQLAAGVRPQVYEEGLARQEKMQELDQLARAPQLAREQLKQLRDVEERKAFAPTDSVATAGSVGELFRFDIKHPVSMARRRSAMLPIVSGEIKAEKVSIYNQSVKADHPLHGVWLTNSTGVKLPAGPITVFDGGTYAGDAQIGHLSPGDKRLLSYAVDLAVKVDPSQQSASRLTAAKIVQGVLQLSRLNTWNQVYTIKNNADGKRTLIIEHPFDADRELVAPESFEEKTPEVYRFRVPIDADTAGKFEVRTQQVTQQVVHLMKASEDSFLSYAKSGEIAPAVRNALMKAAQLKRELEQRKQMLSQLEAQKQQIETGQERLRKNIEAVGRDSELGKRYISKLGEEEDQLESFAMRIGEAQQQVNAKQKELDDYLSGLTVGP